MSEQEKYIILTKENEEKYENIVLERWLRNSERINQQLKGRNYKPEFIFGSNVNQQLRLTLLNCLQSPVSYNTEQGYLIVGYRSVREGQPGELPTLETTSRFVGIKGAAVYSGETITGMNLGITGYYLTHSFSDSTIEPIAIVHTHPRRFPEKVLEYSSSDNRWTTNFLNTQALTPIRGIYTGLAALESPGGVTLKMRTAVTPNIVKTKSFHL